jgi:vitamin B12 transporter
MKHQAKWMPIAVASALSIPHFSYAQTTESTLSPIVVTATRQEMRVSELLSDVTVIDRSDIERSSGETIVELLSRQAGIQFARSGGVGTLTSFFVRGANSDQVKVLVDGLPINHGQALSSGAALGDIPLSEIERIEIVRGPASTLYGADAIGGVIQVFTRKGTQGIKADAFGGYGTQNTFQSNLGVSGGGDNWRFRVAGNYESTDGISALRNAQNQDADRDKYRNAGGSASFSFLPAKGHELGASLRQNEGRAFYDNGSGPDDTFDSRGDFRAEQWQVYSKNHLTSFWNSTLQYGQTSDARTDFSPFTPSGNKLEIENRLLNWQNDVALPLGKLLLAAEYQEQKVSPGSSYGGNDNVHTKAVLAGWTANWDKHSWQFNLREDDHSTFGDKSTYSLAYGYRLTSQWRARTSYGTAFKAPTMTQLYNLPWGGNPLLKPEEARNREIGLTWEQGGQSVSATYYRNDVRNLITYVITLPPFGGQLENVSQARMQGLTLAYDGRFGSWGLHASYDWLQATDETTGDLLARRARNKATFSGTRNWGALETGVELVAVGSSRDPNANNERLGGYGLTNLTARYAVSKAVSIEGRVNNLFDKTYAQAALSPEQPYGTLGTNAFIGIRYTPD